MTHDVYIERRAVDSQAALALEAALRHMSPRMQEPTLQTADRAPARL